MTFGNKLQLLRKSNNMSQEKLAERLNVSRQAISKWEQNIANPDTDNIVIISKFFQVPIEYLLFDKYNSPNQVETYEAPNIVEDDNSRIRKKGVNQIIIGLLIEILTVCFSYALQYLELSKNGECFTYALEYMKHFPLIIPAISGVVLLVYGFWLIIKKWKEDK